MAKPIMQNPTIKGKAAKEFLRLFLSKATPSPERLEQNKKDIELYHSVKSK